MSRLSVPYTVINRCPKSLPVCCIMKCLRIQPCIQHLHWSSPVVKNITLLVCSFHISAKTTRFSSHIMECRALNGDISDDKFSVENNELLVDSEGIRPEEALRRRRIGLANRGNKPWNKGIKHSEETRQRIRQNTTEALSDPKVRKKMRKGRGPLSKQTRARISDALYRSWSKRKNRVQRASWKKSKEKILQLWAESIAEYAKIGGIDQTKLDWDSYEKIKDEIKGQRMKRKKSKQKIVQLWAESIAEYAKAGGVDQTELDWDSYEKIKEEIALGPILHEKEMAQTRKLAKAKAEKMSRIGQDSAITQDKKLKAKLTQIRRKIRSKGLATSQNSRTWGIIDPDSIKKDRIRKQVSLADQIRSVKNIKTQTMMSMKDLTE